MPSMIDALETILLERCESLSLTHKSADGGICIIREFPGLGNQTMVAFVRTGDKQKDLIALIGILEHF